MAESAYQNALRRRREVQDALRKNMQELEKIEKWLTVYREFAAPDEKDEISTAQATEPAKLSLGGKGTAQQLFETYVRAILTDTGRPMRSDEIIEECRARGFPIGGQETRTAWNRMWQAKKNGLVTHVPGLGYWLADTPLSEEGRLKALEAKQHRPRKSTEPRYHRPTGRPPGRQRSVTDAQLQHAEDLIAKGEMTFKAISEHLGIGRPSLHAYFPDGRKGVLAKRRAAELEKLAGLAELVKKNMHEIGETLLTTRAIDGKKYTIGVDGSVDAEAEHGNLHFDTVDEFIAFLNANAPDYSKAVRAGRGSQ